jgi:hypothetical protein
LIQVGIRTATAHQREQAQRFGVETVEARDFQEFDARSILGPISSRSTLTASTRHLLQECLISSLAG